EFDGANIDSTGWLRRDYHLWLSLKLARDYQLLLVPAGKFSCWHPQIARPDVVLFNRLGRGGFQSLVTHKTAARETGAAMQAQKKILTDRAIHQEALALAVLRDDRHTQAANRRRIPGRDLPAQEPDCPRAKGGRFARAQECLQEFGLA